eukprot:gb/GEZJ01007202.1/.p1 GENE.gb/GEZJ01007202.1/~~gb/GEZJ01007202.1/.p1  ORF type:complete len:112 (-),score=8.69 gb/GEZJ01007202.1/:777-1112(-)
MGNDIPLMAMFIVTCTYTKNTEVLTNHPPGAVTSYPPPEAPIHHRCVVPTPENGLEIFPRYCFLPRLQVNPRLRGLISKERTIELKQTRAPKILFSDFSVKPSKIQASSFI